MPKAACSGHTGMPMGTDNARRHGDGRAGNRQCHKQKIIVFFCLPIQESAIFVCSSASLFHVSHGLLPRLFYVKKRLQDCGGRLGAEAEFFIYFSFFFSISVIVRAAPMPLMHTQTLTAHTSTQLLPETGAS